jgi:hypothetical protein
MVHEGEKGKQYSKTVTEKTATGPQKDKSAIS